MAAAQNVIKKYTEGKLQNSSEKTLSLVAHKVWEGSPTTDFPIRIDDQDVDKFIHHAVNDENETAGSIAALKYRLADKITCTDEITWIVAWSNPQGSDNNKVYVDIVNQPIKWDQIKSDLDTMGEGTYSIINKLGYSSSIEIKSDPNSPTPTATPIVRAYILPAKIVSSASQPDA